MKFDKPVITTCKSFPLEEYFDGNCSFCGSQELVVRSSRTREVPDLGTLREKVIARISVATLECKDCNMTFSPEHPLYPPKYEYSQAIIEHALGRSHYSNATGNEIARDLALLHQVQVSPKTIYGWFTKHGAAFTKAKLDASPQALPDHIKSITIDGSYVNLGKKLIGKKKAVDSLSVTRLADGRYLLMWWE